MVHVFKQFHDQCAFEEDLHLFQLMQEQDVVPMLYRIYFQQFLLSVHGQFFEQY